MKRTSLAEKIDFPEETAYETSREEPADSNPYITEHYQLRRKIDLLKEQGRKCDELEKYASELANIIVKDNIHMAEYVAKHMASGLPQEADYDDMMSDVYLALYDSLIRYDPWNPENATFSTYAAHRVKGAVRDFVRKAKAKKGVSRTVDELSDEVSCFEAENQRLPFPKELQDWMRQRGKNIALDTAKNALIYYNDTNLLISLDAPAFRGYSGTEVPLLVDLIPDSGQNDPQLILEKKEVRRYADQILEKLSTRERNVIERYYIDGWNFNRIGSGMQNLSGHGQKGISDSRIGTIHKKTINKIRENESAGAIRDLIDIE